VSFVVIHSRDLRESTGHDTAITLNELAILEFILKNPSCRDDVLVLRSRDLSKQVEMAHVIDFGVYRCLHPFDPGTWRGVNSSSVVSNAVKANIAPPPSALHMKPE
jgi:hypothetical protein